MTMTDLINTPPNQWLKCTLILAPKMEFYFQLETMIRLRFGMLKKLKDTELMFV